MSKKISLAEIADFAAFAAANRVKIASAVPNPPKRADEPEDREPREKKTQRVKLAPAPIAPPVMLDVEMTKATAIRFIDDLSVAGKKQGINDDGTPAFYTNGMPKMVPGTAQEVQQAEIIAILAFCGEYEKGQIGEWLDKGKGIPKLTKGGKQVMRDSFTHKTQVDNARRKAIALINPDLGIGVKARIDSTIAGVTAGLPDHARKILEEMKAQHRLLINEGCKLNATDKKSADAKLREAMITADKIRDLERRINA